MLKENSEQESKGQVSVFLAIVMLVIITFLAFIVNVGLFVKAKINLQNSVDAAAFSGAAVQARQLTNIANLNWELRNTYKEWMFKYYVLGQKGLDATDRNNIFDSKFNSRNMNFRLRQIFTKFDQSRRNTTLSNQYNSNIFDRFNLPSICIHYGSSHNICGIASIPGLPRFETAGITGVTEYQEATLNSIVQTKAEDCSSRTIINMEAAMMWAYGDKTQAGLENVPQIASGRTGAWIEAIELAIRIRNLESIVNTPPSRLPICFNQDAGNCLSIEDLAVQNPDLPIDERTIKAFWSAYRNLGGGDKKESTSDQDTFFSTFKLKEIDIKPYRASELSLSGLLIPSGPKLQKYYLDLEIFPMNYVTFYTLFSSLNSSFNTDDGSTAVTTEASCSGLKAALPVPGYILGFTKNPKVMTYYAVKAEANFVGLFFPFTDREGITLKAYAAAKPFGGRIGPRLFTIDDSLVKARDRDSKNFTLHYASVLNVGSIPTSVEAGNPLPIDPTFWADESKGIGGNPKTGDKIGFVIPNLIYDFQNPSDIESSTFVQNASGRDSILKISGSLTDFDAYAGNISENSGLFNRKQFSLFEANQVISSGVTMTSADVLNSIFRVRRPTKYEALNYLFPVIADTNTNPLNINHELYHFPLNTTDNNTNTKEYAIFGPLYGPGTLYDTTTMITDTLNSFIESNSYAVDIYTKSLKDVSNAMRDASAQATSPDVYLKAADKIYKLPLAESNQDPNSAICKNLSLAQRFYIFYKGPVACGIIPLKDRTINYFNTESDNELYANYYIGKYSNDEIIPGDKKLTAYMPGPRQGALENGDLPHPFGINLPTTLSKRNSYSVKFFALDKATANSTMGRYDRPIGLLMEGNKTEAQRGSNDTSAMNLINFINESDLSEFKGIYHF